MAFEPDAVRGQWRPPSTSRATAARIALGNGNAVVLAESGTPLASAPVRSVEISDRVGSIPRRIGFPDGGLFETDDNDGVDGLFAASLSRRASLVHGLEMFRPRLIVFVLLVLAFSLALYRFAVPVLVEVAVAITPPIVPELMSKGVLASLDKSIFEPTGLSEERRKGISDGFAQLARLSPRGMAGKTASGNPPYTLNFRKGGYIGPNAFALPDGTVVLTDELVDLAKGDDEMVLAVLAHEIGHVEHDHSLRQLYRAAGVTTLIMLIGGDLGGGTQDVVIQGGAVLGLSYSRGAERDADHYSVELMHKAGRDPTAITRFFKIIQEKFGDTSHNDFFSTHPATPERIEDTTKYAEQVAASGH